MHSPEWSEAELAVIRQYMDDLPQLYVLLPSRSRSAIRNKRDTYRDMYLPKYKVREPGDYIEHLSSYLVDEWECLAIWLKWNGYDNHRELSRDHAGWVTLLCTAK